MTKKERHKLILKLINDFEISTQEELTKALNNTGLNVSQATVSRDINELDLIKVGGVDKKIRYAKYSLINNVSDSVIERFKNVVTSIEQAENLIIIRTIIGNAGSAGAAVDSMGIREIMGTVAGDDTLLVIAKDKTDAEKIIKSLRSIKC